MGAVPAISVDNLQHALLSLPRVPGMLAREKFQLAASVLESGAAVIDDAWPEMAHVLRLDSDALRGATVGRSLVDRTTRHVEDAVAQLRLVDDGRPSTAFPRPSDYDELVTTAPPRSSASATPAGAVTIDVDLEQFLAWRAASSADAAPFGPSLFGGARLGVPS